MNARISVVNERLMANAVRALAMDAVEAAKSGHPGMPMGMADVATVLFRRFIKLDPADHQWPDRDRFVLSAGHGSMLLYAINHLLGYPDMPIDEIRRFRQLGSHTPGHPEYGHTQGVEVTTGPLGQGIATSVGMALAERMAAARYPDLVDHRTFVIAGDGCLMEGISQEAIDLAGHLGLGKLVVLWDDNRITIDGSTSVATSTDQAKRFTASGWHTTACDGHDPDDIARAISEAIADARPSLVACRTIIGFGAPNKQGGHDVHGAPLGSAEIAAARQALDWPFAPFDIPSDIYAAWHEIATRGGEARKAWTARLAESPSRKVFLAAQDRRLDGLDAAIAEFKLHLTETAPKIATRKASEMTLDVIASACPTLIGGSADLTGSNLTKAKVQRPIVPGDFAGRYIHYGIREHGMAAAINGIILHGGFRAYGGTFLAFADYCRPSIRLASLMQVPAIHVMTHDSIGLGEDGPTHQPVETLAGLRAIPGLRVYRPCDAIETAEAWQLALNDIKHPSILALSRQNLPLLRTEASPENRVAKGAYVLHPALGKRHVTLIATGSEVELAVAAAEILGTEGIRAAVVSAPSFELFAEQDAAYRTAVLGSAPRIGIEAAIRQSWDGMLRDTDGFIGMTGFGASAPAPDLYRTFGITVEAVVALARTSRTS